MTPRLPLSARVGVERAGGFCLDLPLEIPAGEVVALLGPNGAGKSTALRALAGLEPLTGGAVRLGDETLEDTATGRRVPADRRAVGVVFQDYLLFPHLSALDNVAFGPRAHGVPRAEARALAAGWLERVGLQAYAQARPRRLSGGQAQRVAIARALAVEPALLLLDEPLAALDAATRADTRAELGRVLEAYAGACVLVTHDPLDALLLADRIVVLEAGNVTQQGIPADVAREPRSDYAARVFGLNFYRGTGASDQTVRLEGTGALHTTTELRGDVCVAFAPTAVSLFPGNGPRPEGSPRNCWRVVVDRVDRQGPVVRLHLRGAPPVVADVTPGAVAELGLAPGAELWAAVKATEIAVYPR